MPSNDQHECEHGHAYYDGDQGAGSPYGDGFHDGLHHEHDDAVASWEQWERESYERGFTAGLNARSA